MPNPHRKILRDNDFIYFFKPSLMTMFRHIRDDDSIRFSTTAYEPIANFLQEKLDLILNMAISDMSGTKLTYNDVISYVDEPSLELGLRCNSKKPLSNCYFFPKTSVNRLIRQLTQAYSTDMPIAQDVFIVLHIYIEQLASDVLKKSILAMKHAKRVTVMDTDVTMAVACM